MHSRRQFLKITGTILVGSQIGLRFAQAKTLDDSVYGRALSAVPVYANRGDQAQVVAHLWPDSVTPIISLHGDWYQVPQGYVPRIGLQPMTLYSLPSVVHAPEKPFWAEVAAPVAPVRAYCTADAPLVTRVGHGGVTQIVDHLPGESGGWYAAADDAGKLLGWSQALYWQPVEAEFSTPSATVLEINLNAQHLTAWENDKVVLQAPCSTDPAAFPGHYAIHEQNPGGTGWETNSFAKQHGVPWLTRFGQDFTLGGVYWHNRFGEPTPGMTVQVTPLLARWLYGWLGNAGEIRLV